MKINAKYFFSSCFIVLLIGTSYCFGQETENDLRNKKISMEFKKKPLKEVFFYLMTKYDVPIGFEGSTLDNDHTDYLFLTNLPDIQPDTRILDGYYMIKEHWFTVKAENVRLEEVLNQIVGQMGNYKWEINDDVVNIIPIKGRDERYQKLLELNINSFTFKKNAAVGLIKRTINSLPEVKVFLDQNSIISPNSRAIGQNLFQRIPEEMSFSNLTFRELLNKITKVKRGGWILRKGYLYRSAEKDYIEIDI